MEARIHGLPTLASLSASVRRDTVAERKSSGRGAGEDTGLRETAARCRGGGIMDKRVVAMQKERWEFQNVVDSRSMGDWPGLD